MTERNNVTGGNDIESEGLSVKARMETKARNGRTWRKLLCDGKKRRQADSMRHQQEDLVK